MIHGTNLMAPACTGAVGVIVRHLFGYSGIDAVPFHHAGSAENPNCNLWKSRHCAL